MHGVDIRTVVGGRSHWYLKVAPSRGELAAGGPDDNLHAEQPYKVSYNYMKSPAEPSRILPNVHRHVHLLQSLGSPLGSEGGARSDKGHGHEHCETLLRSTAYPQSAPPL